MPAMMKTILGVLPGSKKREMPTTPMEMNQRAQSLGYDHHVRRFSQLGVERRQMMDATIGAVRWIVSACGASPTGNSTHQHK